MLLGPWCNVFGGIKVILQFYSQCAACSYELFSEVWIDAGGERAAGGRKIETECGSAGSEQYVFLAIDQVRS